MMHRNFISAIAMMAMPVAALADMGEIVPEVNFLTWPAAKYSHYPESSNYVAEQWEKLGLEVNMQPEAFPNPMLSLWFKEHKFDAVLSSLSGNHCGLSQIFSPMRSSILRIRHRAIGTSVNTAMPRLMNWAQSNLAFTMLRRVAK